MPRVGVEEHVQVVALDDAFQVDVDEVLARRRAPVADHQRLHMRQLQHFLEQRVVVEIDLPGRQIVGGTPVSVHIVQQVSAGRIVLHGRGF